MTSETKFTPGPWRVEQGTTLIWGACSHDDKTTWGMGYPIIECRITPALMRSKRPDADEGEANAHLISAAPDMYEALQQHEAFLERLIAMVTGGSDISDADFATSMNALLEMSANALAKARGES